MDTQPSGLALLTDLYELTMAYGYWKSGAVQREAVFHMSFRRQPFQGGFSVACGLQLVIQFLETFRFGEDDLEYLGGLTGNDGRPLFERGFLDYLRDLRFTGNVDAIPEGTVVFPQEPLIRVTGPLLQCQLLESALLNMINFQTLIATKAARICLATRGEPVLEFGLRRAQGLDGAVTASRAAYIGGCAATSNVLAGKIHGIPVKGTHAHSWVMSFASEREAFLEYAKAMPNNCVFLVDTFNTLEGVRRAVEVGQWLRTQGHEMMGIRLDSGDLAYLSMEARKILDAAGFAQATIVATNDLDERVIADLKEQGATIGIWGVGTRLITAFDEPALGGVYKLAAVRDPGGTWQYKLKVSEQVLKVSTPGILQVRRYRQNNEFIGDLIHDELLGVGEQVLVDPKDPTRRKQLGSDLTWEELLVPIFRQGKLVYSPPSIHQIRSRTQEQLNLLHAGIKRFLNPHEYPVGLEERLLELKTGMILAARQGKN